MTYGPVGQPPQGPWQQGPAGWPPAPGGFRQAPQTASTRAIVALIMAIASWVTCGCFCSIPAIFIAKAEMAAIDRGEAPVEGRQLAQIGFWVAIVNACLWGFLCIVYFLLFAAGMASVIAR